MANPFAKLGVDFAKEKVSSFVGDNKSIIDNYIFNDTLKHYFDVDQSFAWRKLKFVLLPFFFQKSEGEVFDAKNDSIFKPELYIPTMSLISFVLIVCLNIIVIKEPLLPDEIANKVFSCLLFTAFEALVCKIAFRIALSTSVPFLNLMAYCSYKYIGLVVYVLFSLIFGNSFWIEFVLRFFLAFSFCSFTVS